MTASNTRIKRVLLAALLVAPVAVSAATNWTFNYENNCVVGACNDNYSGAADWSRQYAAASGDAADAVTVYGLYNTGKDSTTDMAPDNTVAVNGSGQLWLGPIDAWDGLGVHTYGEGWSPPQHSVDSANGIEAVLFDFGAGNLVDLDSVTLGWIETDSDITVLAHTGGGDPTLVSNLPGTGYTNLGSTYAGLDSDGWEHIGSYPNLSTGQARGVNSADKTSRYWMIGAYNPVLDPANSAWSGAKEYFKIRSITASTGPSGGSSVPEPGSLLLMSLGLGLIGHRRLFKS